MSKFQIRCLCGATLEVEEHMSGQNVACGNCRSTVAIPDFRLKSAKANSISQYTPTNLPRTSQAPSQRARSKPSRSRPTKSRSTAPQPSRPPQNYHPKPISKAKSNSARSQIIFLILGGSVLLVTGLFAILAVGIGMFWHSKPVVVTSNTPEPETPAQSTVQSSATEESVEFIEFSDSEIPARPVFEKRLPFIVRFGTAKYQTEGPAGKTKMNIYLPRGEHKNASLGCILIANSGTNPLVGSEPNDDYHDETLPFAIAGYAVINYSLDGVVDDKLNESTAMRIAYNEFKLARAGIANTQAVIRFIEH